MLHIDADALVADDRYPESFGFRIQLADPVDPEWAAEFDGVYNRLPHALKPPVECHDQSLVVHFLPAYGSELPPYLDHLREVVAETNAAVRARNAVLPDQSAEETAFLALLARHADRVVISQDLETDR